MTTGQRIVFYALIGYAVTAGFSITASQISLGIGFLGLLWSLHQDSVPYPWAGFEPAFFGFALACALSIPQAVDHFKAINEMSKCLIILVFSLAYGATLSTAARRTLTGCLLGAGAAAAVMGPLKTLLEHGSWERTPGFFSLPLTFAECQMTLIILTVSWLLNREESPRCRVMLGIALLMQVFGFLASFTRGAIIGLVLGLFVLFRRSPKAIAAVIILCLAGIAGLAALPSMSQRKDAFDTSAATPDGLKNIRLRIWAVGLNILAEHPIFGVGMNNVKPYYRARATAFEKEKNWIYGHLHNTFMQILTMSGMLGLTMFFWFWASISRWCLAVAASGMPPWETRMAETAFPIIVAFLASGMTEYTFGDEEVAMLVFFAIGLVTNAYRPVKPIERKMSGDEPEASTAQTAQVMGTAP